MNGANAGKGGKGRLFDIMFLLAAFALLSRMVGEVDGWDGGMAIPWKWRGTRNTGLGDGGLGGPAF